MALTLSLATAGHGVDRVRNLMPTRILDCTPRRSRASGRSSASVATASRRWFSREARLVHLSSLRASLLARGPRKQRQRANDGGGTPTCRCRQGGRGTRAGTARPIGPSMGELLEKIERAQGNEPASISWRSSATSATRAWSARAPACERGRRGEESGGHRRKNSARNGLSTLPRSLGGTGRHAHARWCAPCHRTRRSSVAPLGIGWCACQEAFTRPPLRLVAKARARSKGRFDAVASLRLGAVERGIGST